MRSVCLLLLCCACRAEEIPEALERLNATILTYLITNTTEAEGAAWNREWKENLVQAEKDDQNYSEEKYTLRVLQTFCEDNVTQLESPDIFSPKRLALACRLFRQCHDRKFSIPKRIRDRLSVGLINNAIKFLEKKISEKR